MPVPMMMTMRPLERLTRFILIAVLAVLVVVPASAGAATQPTDVSPNLARQPTFHRSQSSGVDIGSIRIPTIGLDEVVRSGVAMSVIDRGVAHWAGTVAPGDDGNVVLAGHRTTHSKPFHDLDRLEPGDLVYLEDAHGFEVMYRVRETFIVDPADLWITYDRDEPMLTMFACHPKGSARFRIVVTADLVAGRRIA